MAEVAEDVFEVRDDITGRELRQGQHLCMLLAPDLDPLFLRATIEEVFVVMVDVEGKERMGVLAGYYRNKQDDFDAIDDRIKDHWETGEPLHCE